MTIDLTGGLNDDREFVFATQPPDPEMRESVNVWVWDDSTEFGMPRIGVEAVADQWETHDVQVNLAFADGRVFNIFGPGKVHDPRGGDGKPRILGAGPLSFELVEPFRHWRARVDGTAIADHRPGADRRVDAGCGRRRARARRARARDQVGGAAVGERHAARRGARTCSRRRKRATSWAARASSSSSARPGACASATKCASSTAAGSASVGRAVRRLAAFRGHVWQSSVFPSGRAFGLHRVPAAHRRQAHVQRGLRLRRRRRADPGAGRRGAVARARRAEGRGRRRSCSRRRAARRRIEGETVLSTFQVMGPPMIPALQPAAGDRPLHAGTARPRTGCWNGPWSPTAHVAGRAPGRRNLGSGATRGRAVVGTIHHGQG